MRKKTLSEINYALKDIQSTLKVWQGKKEKLLEKSFAINYKEYNDPYIIKLYKEFDELIVLKQNYGSLSQRG